MYIEWKPEVARIKGDGNAEEENHIDVQSGPHIDSNGRCQCAENPPQDHHESDLKIRLRTEKELKKIFGSLSFLL